MTQTTGPAPRARSGRGDYTFEARFGKIIAAVGIAAIPRALFYYMGELGLSYADVGFLGHLLTFRWTSDLPFPGVEKLARQAGCRASTIQRRRQALEEMGYCAVVSRFHDGRQTSNGYDLSVLFERLEACIRRDWPTVWKDRDPMVGDDGSDDPFGGDDDVIHGVVDNVESGRETDAPPGRVSASPRARVSATGAGREMVTPRAATSLPHAIHAKKQRRPHQKGHLEGDHSGEDSEIRAATIRVASPLKVKEASGEKPSLLLPDTVARSLDAYATQLHDGLRSRAGNATRVRRLWESSRLDERLFLRLLDEAYERALRSKPPAGDRDADQNRSRMPYFFAVLEDLVEAANGDDLGRLWKQTLRQLRVSIRPDVVRRWLAGASLEALTATGDGDELTASIVVPDAHGCAKFDAEYRPTLERALSAAMGEPVRAEIRPAP